MSCCDLLEKSYLCGINNNCVRNTRHSLAVVICLKSLTFVVSITTYFIKAVGDDGCDLLEKSYLCGINNNRYVVKHCVLATYKVVVKINFDPQLKIPFLLNGIFCIVY